jgi:RNA polymerase sigma-70 factor (ECF subfamily)
LTPTDAGRLESGPDPEGSERERCKRAQAGAREAYAEIVREYYPAVRATAFRLVGNPEDAEDLAQECFVRAFRALRCFRGDSPLFAWLRRIVTHLARDRFRREQRARSVQLPTGENEPRIEASPTSAIAGSELTRLVAAGLERLPENLRVALLLRTREELSYEEIADAMGYTPATCRTQVMKARRALLRFLAPYLDERGWAGRDDEQPGDTPAGGGVRP